MADKIHDKGYKRILSRKSTFLHLLRRYINASWLDNVEEQDLELIDKEFILKDFKEREADLVYKINSGGKNKKECYVYVLLELQSSVDYTMPFRLLIYMTQLLMRIFEETDRNKRERKNFRLPPVIPVVLYNGNQPWTVERAFRKYFEDDHLYGERLIDFKYGLIDINSQDESFLLEVNTLLENVIMLDRSHDKETLERALKVTARRIQKLSEEEQIELVDWVRDVLFHKVGSLNKSEVEKVLEGWKKGDEEMMTYGIERAFDKERARAKQEGRMEGKREGKIEGRIEGKREGKIEEKKEIALKLLSMKVDMNVIQEATGLTQEEIKAFLPKQ